MTLMMLINTGASIQLNHTRINPVLLLPANMPPFPWSSIPANLHAEVIFHSDRSSTLWLYSSYLAEG